MFAVGSVWDITDALFAWGKCFPYATDCHGFLSEVLWLGVPEQIQDWIRSGLTPAELKSRRFPGLSSLNLNIFYACLVTGSHMPLFSRRKEGPLAWTVFLEEFLW